MEGSIIGKPIYLEARQHKFISIFTPVVPSRGAIIVVHGLGVNPDWGLIHNLRTGLADGGYTTLSVQMPVLGVEAGPEEYETVFPEAIERLDAATEFLMDKGYKNIAIVSHSMGSRMANAFLARKSPPPIAVWVAIAIPGSFRNPDSLKLPVLDIYGEDDFDIVLAGVSARNTIIKGIPGAIQMRMTGANHFFEGYENELVKQTLSYVDMTLK